MYNSSKRRSATLKKIVASRAYLLLAEKKTQLNRDGMINNGIS